MERGNGDSHKMKQNNSVIYSFNYSLRIYYVAGIVQTVADITTNTIDVVHDLMDYSLEQGSENYGPQAKSTLLSFLMNIVSLQHSYAHSFTHFLWLVLCCNSTIE